MRTNSADQVFQRTVRPHTRSGRVHARPTPATVAAAKRNARSTRLPSTSGYMLAAGITAASLFFVLWWMLHSSGDEAPWFPAGLAASVVMLVAAAARQVVMRRAWTRYILEQDRHDPNAKSSTKHQNTTSSNPGRKGDAYYNALRAVQKKSAEADALGELPEAHLEAYHLCHDYLASTEEALRNGGIGGEARAGMRAGDRKSVV